MDIEGHLRIADFGLSKPQIGRDEKAHSFCGSPEYMAPEMLEKKGHNRTVDFYCLGALLYELLTGLPPYYSTDTQQIYDNIVKSPLTFPQDVRWHLEPSCRSRRRSSICCEGCWKRTPMFGWERRGGFQRFWCTRTSGKSTWNSYRKKSSSRPSDRTHWGWT